MNKSLSRSLNVSDGWYLNWSGFNDDDYLIIYQFISENRDYYINLYFDTKYCFSSSKQFDFFEIFEEYGDHNKIIDTKTIVKLIDMYALKNFDLRSIKK